MSWDEKAKKLRFQRGQGASEEAKAALNKFNEAQTDWVARCRVCGEALEGTLAQIKAHKHDS